MQDPGAVASRAVQALQQWYGADPYSRDKGIYSYHDPALDAHWADWSSLSRIGRNFVNTAIALTGQRNRIQDTTRWWNSANAITAVIGYMSASGDRSYLKSVVENTFTKAPGVHRPVTTWASLFRSMRALRRASYPGFINGFYDDEGWWALAWIDAYDLTGEEKYLTAAEDIFLDMTGGWDDVWSGGIYWGKYNGQPDRTGAAAVPAGWHGPYKNAIANELFISVAAALAVRQRHRYPEGKNHADCLNWALRGWAWVSSPAPHGVAMINAAGLVNDSPDSNGVNNNTEAIWSYNQGVLLRGLSDLTELTGDQAYRARAEAIADAFIKNPWYQAPQPGKGQKAEPPPTQSGVIHGILHEHDDCQADGSARLPGRMPGINTTMFKGIFVRNLARLYRATEDPSYRQFILANAQSALGQMNEHYQFGCNWAAPVDVADFVRQAAGIDLLNAALVVSKDAGTATAADTAQPPGA
jgi:predicted alpha-1,6-mannanase (GH76 family)